jgi:sec-independent protein translocase protein TatA
MGDVAKGIKNFRKGMSDEEAEAEAAKTVEHKSDEKPEKS